MQKVMCLLLALWMTLCAGCDKQDPIPMEDVSLGVIETRGDRHKSRIIFYDQNLQELGDLPLPYATVGDTFSAPLVVDRTLYSVVQGLNVLKDAETVLEIDLSNCNVTKHHIAQPAMNSVAASETYVYTCNTLNGVSYINQCDRKTGETQSVSIPAVYISHVFYADHRLYAFSTADRGGLLWGELLIYDETLTLLDKVDIHTCGADTCHALVHNGMLFFTAMVDVYDQPISTIGVVDLSDLSVQKIALHQVNPLDLAIYNGKMYITHFDIVGLSGGGLSVYDLETGAITDYDFPHGAEHMSITGDHMYILSDWKIYKYDLANMECVKSIDVSHIDRHFSYLAGLFAVNA